MNTQCQEKMIEVQHNKKNGKKILVSCQLVYSNHSMLSYFIRYDRKTLMNY